MTDASPHQPDAHPPDADARHVSPWTTRQKIARVVWWFVQATVWRWSWHNAYGVRRLILRSFGASVDPTSRIRPTARIECPWNLTLGGHCTVGDRSFLYALGPIRLGDRVTVSQHSHLCAGTHDIDHPDQVLVVKPIVIENDAWVAADAFVGPGVTIGEGAVLGARGVTVKDLPPWTIYAGNPAKHIRDRDPEPHRAQREA